MFISSNHVWTLFIFASFCLIKFVYIESTTQHKSYALHGENPRQILGLIFFIKTNIVQIREGVRSAAIVHSMLLNSAVAIV